MDVWGFIHQKIRNTRINRSNRSYEIKMWERDRESISCQGEGTLGELVICWSHKSTDLCNFDYSRSSKRNTGLLHVVTLEFKEGCRQTEHKIWLAASDNADNMRYWWTKKNDESCGFWLRTIFLRVNKRLGSSISIKWRFPFGSNHPSWTMTWVCLKIV